MNITAKAFLFDLNGTVIDDMRYHTVAWHNIISNDLQKEITIEAVKQEMYGKNEEVLDRIFGKGYFDAARAGEISMEKERRYQQTYLPELRLIDGLQAFLDQSAKAGISMAIGSAAIPFNINFVLDNLHLHDYFKVIVSASDVVRSKPDPETFTKCADLLNVAPADCIVFEDAPKGVEAAYNAGMRALVLTTTHEEHEFSQYDNIIGFVKDYTTLRVGE
jgi:beta-phosphoglucomutase